MTRQQGLRVKTRAMTYPADAASLQAVRDAGGVSKLTDAERARLKFKTVPVGGRCDDMPPESVARYLERGEIEAVPLTPETTPRTRRGRR